MVQAFEPVAAQVGKPVPRSAAAGVVMVLSRWGALSALAGGPRLPSGRGECTALGGGGQSPFTAEIAENAERDRLLCSRRSNSAFSAFSAVNRFFPRFPASPGRTGLRRGSRLRRGFGVPRGPGFAAATPWQARFLIHTARLRIAYDLRPAPTAYHLPPNYCLSPGNGFLLRI